MEPKRYIGNDLNRLFARIRRELGPDAMIVRTRSLLREGAEPLVEVMAAVPVPGDDLPPLLGRAMVQSVLSRLDPAVTVGDIEDMLSRETSAPFPAQPVPVAEVRSPRPAPAIEPQPSEHTAFDESALLDQLAVELERRSTSASPVTHLNAPLEVPAPRPLAATRRPSIAGDVRGHLRSVGFSALSVETVHETAPREPDAVQALTTTLQRGVLTYPDEDLTAILTVQGATGFGRTTALLRMALDCARAGRPAYVISMTADGQEAARLRAFARPAGIRFEAGRDWKAVGRLARAAAPGSCLFLDVPAGPWRMPLPVGVRHFRYLAIPAIADTAQLGEALDAFDIRPFSGAVLTFGDRSRTLLPAVDFLVRSGLGVAFVSDGPDATTGIAVADPFMLASGSFTTSTGVVTDGRLPAIA